MPRVLVRSIDEAAPGPFPAGFSLDRGQAFPVLAGSNAPIPLHRLRLEAGGCPQVRDAGNGVALYVRRGELAVADMTVGAGGSIIVEHRASTEIEAREESELICFMIGD